jgi:hypothetical protein
VIEFLLVIVMREAWAVIGRLEIYIGTLEEMDEVKFVANRRIDSHDLRLTPPFSTHHTKHEPGHCYKNGLCGAIELLSYKLSI